MIIGTVRVFDWTSGQNEPGAPSYRFFLDGDELAADAKLFRAITPASPGVDGWGRLYFYKTDAKGNIIGLRDAIGVIVDADSYWVEGLVRWEYA